MLSLYETGGHQKDIFEYGCLAVKLPPFYYRFSNFRKQNNCAIRKRDSVVPLGPLKFLLFFKCLLLLNVFIRVVI